ncbi:TlpA family protein disulfide reductase [Knoellia sp. CPCC 206453]|uniref:TlpA family protein disulfide reductase n=1 Tax=Knoellia pratensis TaxID=3404796 RepID=UPI00361354CB
MEPLTGAVVLAWLAIVVLALAVSGLLRRVKELSEQGVGAAAVGPASEEFTLPAVDPSTFGAAKIHIVLVVDPLCSTCHEVLPHLAQLSERADPVEESFHAVSHESRHGWDDTGFPVIIDDDLTRQLDVPWRPGVALVDQSGNVVKSRPVGSVAAFYAALEEFRHDPAALSAREGEKR